MLLPTPLPLGRFQKETKKKYFLHHPSSPPPPTPTRELLEFQYSFTDDVENKNKDRLFRFLVLIVVQTHTSLWVTTLLTWKQTWKENDSKETKMFHANIATRRQESVKLNLINIGMMLKEFIYPCDKSTPADAYLLHDNCHISKLTLLSRDARNKYLNHHGNAEIRNNLPAFWT